MTPSSLAEKCAESMNALTAAGLSLTDARILIVTPKGWKAPPKFPRGETVQVKEDGSRVRYVSAMNVLAWLAANGLVKVQGA